MGPRSYRRGQEKKGNIYAPQYDFPNPAATMNREASTALPWLCNPSNNPKKNKK
jgi:hypothetical protein